eukprot:686126-Prorocentrum_minimum.AAC.1
MLACLPVHYVHTLYRCRSRVPGKQKQTAQWAAESCALGCGGGVEGRGVAGPAPREGRSGEAREGEAIVSSSHSVLRLESLKLELRRSDRNPNIDPMEAREAWGSGSATIGEQGRGMPRLIISCICLHSAS